MPLKIRCRGCEKVLSLPDRARGKTVRCPQCETRIKVPAGAAGAAAASPKRKATAVADPAHVDDDDFLADLDLDRIEDRHARVCPKCGADVPDEEFECRRCGIDIRTGRLSDRRRRKLERKGPDPAEFTGKAPADAWRFLSENFSLAGRTAAVLVGFTALAGVFGFFWAYFYQIPLKMFFGLLTVVAFFAGPGWLWFFYLEVLEGTLAKKRKLKRVKFDFFLNVSLGLKAATWFVAFALPVFLLPGGAGVALYFSGYEIPGLILIGVALLPVLALVPLAMPHMVMPITAGGWLSPKIVGTFFRRAARPALFWLLFFLLTNIPALALVGVAGGVGGQGVVAFFDDVVHNATIDQAKAYEYAKNEEPNPEIERWKTADPRELQWSRLYLPGGLLAGACIAFGLAAPFWMRMNGTLLHHYKDHLDLEKFERQAEYKAKSVQERDQFLQTYNATLLRVGLVACMGGVCVLILSIVVAFLSVWAPESVAALEQHMGLIGAIGLVVTLIGRSLCLTVPEDSGVRELIIGSLLLDGFAFLVAMGAWLELEFVVRIIVSVVFVLAIFQPFLLMVLLLLLAFGGTVVFLKAAIQIADYLRRQDVASFGTLSFQIIAWLWGGLLLLSFVPLNLLATIPAVGKALEILLYVGGGGFLIALLAYVLLLWKLNDAWGDPTSGLKG